jgi:hypothetical protein
LRNDECCIDMICQGIITSANELEEFLKEVEDRFLELSCDENLLFKTLNEIDEQHEKNKWESELELECES